VLVTLTEVKGGKFPGLAVEYDHGMVLGEAVSVPVPVPPLPPSVPL
jgi:hypothetical protein